MEIGVRTRKTHRQGGNPLHLCSSERCLHTARHQESVGGDEAAQRASAGAGGGGVKSTLGGPRSGGSRDGGGMSLQQSLHEEVRCLPAPVLACAAWPQDRPAVTSAWGSPWGQSAPSAPAPAHLPPRPQRPPQPTVQPVSPVAVALARAPARRPVPCRAGGGASS